MKGILLRLYNKCTGNKTIIPCWESICPKCNSVWRYTDPRIGACAKCGAVLDNWYGMEVSI